VTGSLFQYPYTEGLILLAIEIGVLVKVVFGL
jgi:hypothetical protein